MKTNKKIIWLLGAVLIVIWGVVAYQIVSAIYSGGDTEVQGDNGLLNGTEKKAARYVYVENVRDPFRYFVPVAKAGGKKAVLQQPQINVTPPFRLSGIIVNDNRRTAVIEGQDGSVWFVQEKDTLSELQIIRIKEKSVIYSYHKRKGIWNLPQ